MRYRLAVTFAIDGDLRFISHLDTVRLFARALVRARLPVKYSQGFNPQPKLWLPLPRPVGMASDHEMLLVECTEPVDPGPALEKLDPQMPDGIKLLGANPWPERKLPRPAEVTYNLGIDPRQYDCLAENAERLLRAHSLTVTRSYGPGKPTKAVDIRQGIERITVLPDRIQFTLAVPQTGGARPREVLERIGLDPKQVAHRIRRTHIAWA